MTMGNSDDENGEICLTENNLPTRGRCGLWLLREMRLIVLAFLRGRARNVHKVGICALRMLFLPPVKEDREMAGLL